ncbi:50S ribosomal protein L20 [Patescibacteria group bacterium]|nr:MAG: 50S ribosomal protein L20 [Patescibacteria group bacterium]
MPRVKRGIHHVKRRRNILRKAKGYKWGRKSKLKLAKIAVIKAGKYAYRDRRTRKRDFRALWLVRLNAALRPLGLSYSAFMAKVKKNGVALDRKSLAALAEKHPTVFQKIVENIKR